MDSRVKNLWGVATQEPTTVMYTTHTQRKPAATLQCHNGNFQQYLS